MNRFLNDNGVKSIQAATHAHTVERAIKTIKNIFYRILGASKQSKSEWVKHI